MDGMWAASDKVSIGRVSLTEEKADDHVPHILIVEDDRGINSLIETAIAGVGYQTTCAFSGAEALRLLGEDTFDLVILDVMLGEISGWDVFKEFNRRGLHDRTKVMMLTARGSELDVLQGWNLGADEYMTKPFDVGAFIEAVQRLVNLSPETLKSEREAELERSRLLSLVEGAFGDEF